MTRRHHHHHTVLQALLFAASVMPVSLCHAQVTELKYKKDTPPGHEAVPAACSPSPTALSSFDVREDLELTISAVEAALPDIYWHQSEAAWDAAKARARIQSEAVTSDEGLQRVIRTLLFQIGEGHMTVDACKHLDAQAALFPLDLLWREDGIFVVTAYGDAQDIAKGTKLLAINGQTASQLLDDLFHSSPHDGSIRTGVMRDEGSRYATMRRRMHGPEAAFHLVLEDKDGQVREREVHAVTAAARPASERVFDPVAHLAWVNRTTAYLSVPSFSNKRYRKAGADYAATLQKIFTELHDRGAENLILDLRENGGGSEPNEKLLFSYLVGRPVREYAYVRSRGNDIAVRSFSGQVFATKVYDDDEIASVRHTDAGYLERKDEPPIGLRSSWHRAAPVFPGRLVTLVGGHTFSGAAELASLLYAQHRGIFVGEEVGGTHAGNTSGHLWTFILPHSHIEIGIPLLAFRFTWPDVPKDRGVMPSCKAPPSVWDTSPTDSDAYRTAIATLGKRWSHPPTDDSECRYQRMRKPRVPVSAWESPTCSSPVCAWTSP